MSDRTSEVIRQEINALWPSWADDVRLNYSTLSKIKLRQIRKAEREYRSAVSRERGL